MSSLGEGLDKELTDLRGCMQDLSDSWSEFAVCTADSMKDIENRMTELEKGAELPGTPAMRTVRHEDQDGPYYTQVSLEQEADFSLTLGELQILEATVRELMDGSAKDVALSPMRVKLWNEILVRKAMQTVVDKRPLEDLTYLQQEGRKSSIKGARNELAVCTVLNNHEKKPEWLYSARTCTFEEDGQGIDVVVDTDVGNLHIQVKSSYENAKKFRRKWPMRNVGIAVIRPRDDRDTIFNKAIDAVAKQRSELQKDRYQL